MYFLNFEKTQILLLTYFLSFPNQEIHTFKHKSEINTFKHKSTN